MEIKETMYQKNFDTTSENTYFASLDILKKISSIVKITESKNSYETDGPNHRSEVTVMHVEGMDNFSRTVFVLSFSGENRSLEISSEGRFETRIKESGFFSETFAAFYFDRIFPVLRKRAEKRIEEIALIIESAVKQTVKVTPSRG